MIEPSTLYLIFCMALFLLVTVLAVHRFNCREDVKRKTGKVEEYAYKMQQKIDVLEKEIIDLKIEVDEIDDEIEALKTMEGK